MSNSAPEPIFNTVPEKTESQDLRLDGYVDERSAVCVASFVNGFASGWFFAVPESFKDALDMKLTERSFKKAKYLLWTQGECYSISHGDVFYDTPDAYENEDWKTTLSKITYCIQVTKTRTASIVVTKTYKAIPPVPVIEDNSENPKPHLQNISYSRSRMDFGFVQFKMMKPDILEGKLVEEGIYETDQELFIRFLQTGLLRCNDGTNHDFTVKANMPASRLLSVMSEQAQVGV